jgi:hypothetical protein
MKTRLSLYNMPVFMIIGMFLLSSPGFSMQETTKTITKTVPVSPQAMITFSNKIGSLVVETWGQNQVKIETTVIIDGNEESTGILLGYIGTLDFEKTETGVSFSTKFYTQYTEGFPGGIRIILADGKKVTGLTKLEISYRLTVPLSNPLTIINKYEDVTLPDLAGKINLEVYECHLSAGNLSDDAVISMKYSDGVIASVKNLSLSLYESEAEINTAGDLILESKYSKLNIRQTGSVILDCYEDHLLIGKHGNVSGEAKYSTLTLSDCDVMNLSLYECTLHGGTLNSLSLRSKYSKTVILSASQADFTEAYESEFSSTFVGSLKAFSKYCEFTISHLDKELTLPDSYEDNLTISRMSANFTGITVNSKYTDLSVSFDPGALYRLTADLQYTDYTFPESGFKETRYHKDGSTFIYSGMVSDASETASPLVNLKMYEGKVNIR